MIDDLIVSTAERYELPVKLVRAIVAVESSGNPWATRYEPAFYARYVHGKGHTVFGNCSRSTEEISRAMSWGLMQIMGQTARENGFKVSFLAALCDPAAGLDWGCFYLARQIKRYQGNLEAAVAAYNAGSATRDEHNQWRNQGYVNKIRAAGGL